MKEGFKLIGKAIVFGISGFFITMFMLVGCVFLNSTIGEWQDRREKQAQCQTPMDEKYVGVRWRTEEDKKVEMYFDVFEEGQPPLGIWFRDDEEIKIALIGPYKSGTTWEDYYRIYYVVPADAELLTKNAQNKPEEYLLWGRLRWSPGRSNRFSFELFYSGTNEPICDVYFLAGEISDEVFQTA